MENPFEAEIKRLKIQHEEMLLKHAKEQHVALSALDEAMKEIERLTDKIRGLEKLNQMTDEEVVIQLKAEIEGLKSILSRAADALEKSYSPMWSNQECHAHSKLIAELRKAAE